MYDEQMKLPYNTTGQEVGTLQRASMTERLTRRQDELTRELRQVTETLTLLRAHPETQEVLDALARMNFGF